MRRFRRFSGLLAVLVAAGALRAAQVPANMLLLDGALAGTTIVAVGERGAILRSPDSGLSWHTASSGTLATLTGVSFASDGLSGWAVGHDATILTSADAGRTWRKSWQGDNLEFSLLDVCALDAGHVIAIGAYGLFLESRDGGQSWIQRKILDEDMHLNRLSRGPDGSLYLAGERGTLLHSHDQGATWEGLESPYEGSFYGLTPLDARTLLAYGLRGRLYRSTDAGATWTLVPVPQPVLLATALSLRDGSIVLAGQSRALFVSRDGGQSIAPWDVLLTTAVAELVETPAGSVLALGEAGATVLPQP